MPDTTATDADAMLMMKTKAGDDFAFSQLFSKYRRPIVGFCRRMLRDSGRAEEAAQEVFLRIYRAKDRYEPSADFRYYIYRIATNVCLNGLRTRDRLVKETDPEQTTTERVVDDAAVLPDDALAAGRLQHEIAAAIDKLPHAQRTAFVLLRWHDLSYEAIAAEMGISVSAVKSHLNRARAELLSTLAPHLERFTVPYLRVPANSSRSAAAAAKLSRAA